jgi:CheY-like chemotaxis protein
MTKIRFQGRFGGSLVNATTMRLQYHLGGNPAVVTGDAGWTTLATSAGSHGVNGLFYTAEETIPTAARVNNVLLRACVFSGDGAADPTITNAQLNVYPWGGLAFAQEVDAAHDWAEDEELASSTSYDIIILDIVMPVKNGIEVCRDLRAAGVKSHILILSSKESEEDKVGGLDAGVDDYMFKPFGFYELSARLKALERWPRADILEKISFGNITIDPDHKLLVMPAGPRLIQVRAPILCFSRKHILWHHDRLFWVGYSSLLCVDFGR